MKAAAFAPLPGSAFDARILERVRHEPAPVLRLSVAWLAAAAALIVAVSSAVLMVSDHAATRPQAREVQAPPDLDAAVIAPGWNEGRALEGAECGLPGGGPCIIEGARLVRRKLTAAAFGAAEATPRAPYGGLQARREGQKVTPSDTCARGDPSSGQATSTSTMKTAAPKYTPPPIPRFHG